MNKLSIAALVCVAALVLGSWPAAADTLQVRFYSDQGLVSVLREAPDGADLPIAAAKALVAGPDGEEAAIGFKSALPEGTRLMSADVTGETIKLDLSPEVLEGLDEARLTEIFDQFKATLGDFPWIMSIRLTCKGELLSTYLPVGPAVGTAAPTEIPKSVGLAGLGGRNITIGPSHGRFWNGSGWYWQRSDPCGYGEAVLEDTNSIRLMQFLYQYLAQDGATVHVPRELNESNCCNGYTGLAWWKMAAYSWLRANGLPCSVWANSSGNCGEETATGRSSDDIRARPKFADYRGSNIYIAHHTNAGGGTGMETFRDTAMEYPAHEANSYTLALNVHNNTLDAIHEMYDGGFANRGVKDSAGGFGEIRIPNRPACLVELAFHDKCDKDAIYLTDDFFRSVAMWGMYKGICSYFGTSPTWDKYSDEYVSNTVPATMESGKSYTVSVTFRNRGVLWREGRAFRLGAVGDSDPFTSATRHTISGDVRPGNTYTFTFTMTAPGPGTYTTDWRMVRDGVAWFGATFSKTVTVTASDTQAPSVPTGLTATPQSPVRVNLSWTASTDNTGVTGYDIRRNGAVIGTSTGTTYSDSGLTQNTDYTYEVRAKDAYGNVSGWSTSALAHTPADTQAPTVPTNLAANATSSTTVALTWTASTDDAGVTGYDIRRDGAVIGSSTGTSYNDSGLTGGVLYVYEVRAKDAVPNYSAWSASKSVRTPVSAVDVFIDGFNGNLANWTQTSGKDYAYSTGQNHGSYTGGGAAYCGALESDQMTHYFDRPFAQGTVSGYFYDPKGGWKQGVCGNAYRQAISLRNPGDTVNMFLDNCFYSATSNSNYFYRKLGGGGSTTYTSYATRNPNTDCNGAWVYFETSMAPNARGMSPTGVITIKVADGAGTTTTTTDLQTDFFSFGIGRIVLGLGVSSVGESYWDDIRFTASPPGQPAISAATALSTSSIRWDFSAIDNNVFGLDVMNTGGTQVSPAYPSAGWVSRDAASFTETGLAPNTPYTRKVRAWNGTLNSGFSATATKWTLSAPASAASVTCDRSTGTLYATPGFNFTAVGGFGQGKVDHYLYAWDKNPSHTFTGTESSWNSGDLALTASTAGSWYLHVQAFNGEGVANGSFDLGPYNYASAVNPIGAAWSLADGAGLALQDKIVTHASQGALWIEEADRSAALKVLSAATAARGDRVSVAGVLGLSGAQRVLTASDVGVTASGQQVPAPVWMLHKALGGQSFNAATPGVTGATGLYNAALLVSSYGFVKSVDISDPENKYFYFDDGCGLQDGSGRAGVRVRIGANTEPAVGSLVKVTGVVELETIGGKVAPVILARDAADVSPLQ